MQIQVTGTIAASKPYLRKFRGSDAGMLQDGSCRAGTIGRSGQPRTKVYYLPMQAVHKEDSTTNKTHIVFDDSAKSTSGTSLNDHLLIGPTVQPLLIDVLLRFRKFKVLLTTDVSRMYRAIRLADNQKDLHHFLRRADPKGPVKGISNHEVDIWGIYLIFRSQYGFQAECSKPFGDTPTGCTSST